MKEFLSRIGFGCVGLTALDSEKSALSILEATYSNGVRHFDTSDIYGKGYSEAILGKFIKNKRENIHIATKFGLGNCKKNILPVDFAIKLNKLRKKLSRNNLKTITDSQISNLKEASISRDYANLCLKNSLSRLKTNYLDYYFLHEKMPYHLENETTDFLSNLKEKGIIRKLGVGSSIKKYHHPNNNEYRIFDTIQHEANLLDINIFNLLKNKEQIIHSLYNLYNSFDLQRIPYEERFGFLIGSVLLENPESKVIFSSSKIKNIENNIKYGHKYFSDIDLTNSYLKNHIKK